MAEVADPKRPERLNRAPIVEALIDIHVEPHATLDQVEPFGALAAEQFPDRKRVIEWRGNLDLREDEVKMVAPPAAVKGYAFWAADKKRVLQARMNGFSYSQLAPYDKWSSLRDDARSWFEKFSSVVKPTTVTRCAVRFVNRIELPLPVKDFNDYLKTFPQVAPGLPQGLSSVFMRVAIAFPQATAIVTEAIDESGVTSEKIPIILDIDVSATTPIPSGGDELWDRLEKLRVIKNDVFFNSLTPLAWRLFE